jgi:hypothetical protein
VCLILMTSLGASQPTRNKTENIAFWKDTPMDGVVQELEMMCTQRNDHVSCLKFKVLRLLDEMFKQDSYKVSTQNNRQNFIKLDIAWSSA